MIFRNVYEDTKRAEAYAKLGFPGTYYLAYRDLPAIIGEHVQGTKAIDFGCGTGRSTRFLRTLGFDAVGVDIAEDMIKQAKENDPQGDYRIIGDGDLSRFESSTFDLALCVFTFDNIPTMEKKVACLQEIGRLLTDRGKIVNLVSSPDIYKNEWASFTTRDFPENKAAKCGDRVKIVMTDVEDRRPVEDVIWPDEDYQKTYQRAGLEVMRTYKPLAKRSEPFQWINETTIAPWVIYVLRTFSLFNGRIDRVYY